MSTFTKRIANSNDDGYKRGSLSWSVGSVVFGDDSYWGDNIVGLRFNSVTVPSGAIINSAKITIRPTGESNYQYYQKIYGIDEDDTADFSSDPTGRAKTTASVDWDPNGFFDETDIDTSNIGSIVQEIIDRAGWSSGNDMGFLILDDGGSSHTVDVYDYSSSPSFCALLTIEYTTGSPSPSPTPSSSPSRSPSLSISLSPSLSPSTSLSSSPSSGDFFGIKISKPGFDVKTETNPENLIFTSAKGVLGWRSTQTISGQTGADGIMTAEYTHSLGYIPMIFCFVTTYGGKLIMAPNSWETTWDGDEQLLERFYFYVDATKIYVKAVAYHYQPVMGGSTTNLAGQTYNFQAVIYFNELNDEH